MTTEARNTGVEGPHLRRELHIWEAVGISLALMAPSMAANINPQGTAGSVGRAVSLAFALATIGVLLIAWTFARLTQRFDHAGSVYGFVGATLGPHAGVISGSPSSADCTLSSSRPSRLWASGPTRRGSRRSSRPARC
jgi:amino acid transporter